MFAMCGARYLAGGRGGTAGERGRGRGAGRRGAKARQRVAYSRQGRAVRAFPLEPLCGRGVGGEWSARERRGQAHVAPRPLIRPSATFSRKGRKEAHRRRAMSPDEPWLALVGIGEDGLEGLFPSARRRTAQATLVGGGARHLELACPLSAPTLAWPSPIEDAIPRLTHGAAQFISLAAKCRLSSRASPIPTVSVASPAGARRWRWCNGGSTKPWPL